MSRCLSWMAAAGVMTFSAQGASWVVWPGQSVQTAVSTAAPGDNIILKEGIYTENVTLGKGLDIRGESGKKASTILNGNFTIANATAPVYLAGFTIGSAARSNVTVNACSDVRMDDMAFGALSVSSSKYYVYNSTAYSATFLSASWTAQRTTFSGNLTSTYSPTKLIASTVTGWVSHSTRDQDCTIFQSVISSQPTAVTADNYWIGYNRLFTLSLTGTGVCEVVGNRIYQIGPSNIVSLNASSPTIRNNVIVMQNGIPSFSNSACIHVGVNSPFIVNNTITYGSGGYYGRGMKADVGSRARLVNNFFLQDGSTPCVDAPATVELRYCYLFNSAHASFTSGGVVPVNCNLASAAPSFVNTSDPTSTNYYRVNGTTLSNAGDPDPQYNDLDNTRSDYGVWGGHAYDPQGLTTTNPVVIWADASPLYIKRGEVLRLRARGAVRAQ